MTDHVMTQAINGVGTITLDRQQALNALTLPMVRAITTILAEWRDDPAIQAVTIAGLGKAFCAGGDIRAIRDAACRGEQSEIDTFFGEEYGLNLIIHTYPKPFIALIDGICMGGGMGLSVHASCRILTEKTMMAMPETAIGFFPDAGASYFLSRLPGRTGPYLAMTGARLSAADAIWSGLATHFVPSAALATAHAAIMTQPDDIEAAIRPYLADPGPSILERMQPAISRCFASWSPEACIAAVEAEAGNDGNTEWADATLAQLRVAAPDSLHLASALMKWGRTQDIASCLAQELKLARVVTAGHNFIEGVRAVLVDRDRNPSWQPMDHAIWPEAWSL